jgi:hypothetical protein
MEGFIKYAVEMGSGVMIYIPSFIKIGSGIKKLIGGAYTDTQHGDRISLLLFLAYFPYFEKLKVGLCDHFETRKVG